MLHVSDYAIILGLGSGYFGILGCPELAISISLAVCWTSTDSIREYTLMAHESFMAQLGIRKEYEYMNILR
jgi:hypothetical protein